MTHDNQPVNPVEIEEKVPQPVLIMSSVLAALTSLTTAGRCTADCARHCRLCDGSN